MMVTGHPIARTEWEDGRCQGQRPERTPQQGAKVTSRISGESEPLCVAGASH